MKGAIFKLFEDYVVTAHGEHLFDDLLDEVELETTEPFVGPGTYPAGDLVSLVVGASARLDIGVDDLLRRFGRHAFPALAASVPTLMEGLGDPCSFLLALEKVVHTEVRKLDPEADPPRFTVTEEGPGRLRLGYHSSLGLFPLVEGLLDGVGDHFGVPLTHERISTDGSDAVFRVLVPDGAPGTGSTPGPDHAVAATFPAASASTSASASAPAGSPSEVVE